MKNPLFTEIEISGVTGKVNPNVCIYTQRGWLNSWITRRNLWSCP